MDETTEQLDDRLRRSNGAAPNGHVGIDTDGDGKPDVFVSGVAVLPDGRTVPRGNVRDGAGLLADERLLPYLTNVPGHIVSIVARMWTKAQDYNRRYPGVGRGVIHYIEYNLRLFTSISGKRAQLMADVEKAPQQQTTMGGLGGGFTPSAPPPTQQHARRGLP